jgi:hypothetical protein
MKIKIKKSELKRMLSEETARIFSPETSPLLEAIDKLLEMYQVSDDGNKERLDEVFTLIEKELMLDKSGKKIKDLINV